MNCCICQRFGKSERLPHGWKRFRDCVYCERCWRERYTLRSVAVPVVEPIGEVWADFRDVLKQGWIQATAAANWMITELYARDIRRKGEEKMPSMGRVYLYPEARRLFPCLAPQTVVSIENTVQATYRAARYEVVWTCAASLPTYRYPRPLPVHNQSWEATIAQERPVVRVRLGDRWWKLRLKGGPRFRPQTEAYRQIVAGEAVKGELALYRVRAHDGKLDGRPNGQQKVKYTVICKMAVWLPRGDGRDAQEPAGILRVRTADDMFLLALNLKDKPVWRYHGDHLRRWTAQHRKALQNFADDHKTEHRHVPSFADRRTAAALKYRNRTRSAIREIAAQLVGYAARNGFSAIEYDDSVTGFCPEFQYWALCEQIRTKCDEQGLGFQHSNGIAESEEPELFANLNESDLSGPPVGPARPTADTLDGLTARGRL